MDIKFLSATSAFILGLTVIFGQNEIEWDGKYQLQFSDFQSSTTQIGGGEIYSLYASSGFDFAFFYSNQLEFMMTRNFNPKVNCLFKRGAASLVAPDSATAYSLLNFARYQFDLSELYARKFRLRLYEAKGTFSNPNFCKPLYDEVEKEYVERHTIAAKETDVGRDKEKLLALHREVKAEIDALSDFCKSCKPPRKKK